MLVVTRSPNIAESYDFINIMKYFASLIKKISKPKVLTGHINPNFNHCLCLVFSINFRTMELHVYRVYVNTENAHLNSPTLFFQTKV